MNVKSWKPNSSHINKTKVTSALQITIIIKDSTQLESVSNTLYFITVINVISGPRICAQLMLNAVGVVSIQM